MRRCLEEPQFRARCHPGVDLSKLDPYKTYIRRLIDFIDPYSFALLLNRLREAGSDGAVTLCQGLRATGPPKRRRAPAVPDLCNNRSR